MTELLRNAGEARRAIARGELRAQDLVRASLRAIDEGDAALGAFLRTDPEGALAGAARTDEARARGDALAPLAGIPVAVKDNICTRGLETTAGSRMLRGFIPDYDATVVARLREAGAVVVGKTNLDEFGMGSSTENSAWGPTRNPWDHRRSPGGSSGGSAAAVSAGMTPLALGSETGGSVRQPASFCGLVGLKPTYGRLSRWGLVAFASSLDSVGLLATHVADCALLAGVVAGEDPRDSTSARVAVPDYLVSIEEPARPLCIGVPREYFGEGLDGEVDSLVRASLARLESAGARLVEVSLATTPQAIAAYYLVATAEASANLARYDGVRYGHRGSAAVDLADMYRRTRGEGFGAEVKRRIMLGTYALSAGYYEAYYLRAQQVRALLAADFARAFERCDLLVTPATPTAAFCLGEKTQDPLAMYLSDVYTCPANLAGVPALALPAGRTRAGLPVGVQLIGPPFSEALLFRAGRELERLLALEMRPPAGAGQGPHPENAA
jgi:aspartyl-tRNA(Asn)/glutamyl-tRNA(Gln) amidotransferase subunit A